MTCQCSSCRSESLRMGFSTEQCSFCQISITKDTWYQFIGDKISCEKCYKINYKICRICGKTHLKDDIAPADINFRGEAIVVCNKCLAEQFKICLSCGKPHYRGDLLRNGDQWYCQECFHARFDTCPVCKKIYVKGKVNHRIYNNSSPCCFDCFGTFGPIIHYEHTTYLQKKGKEPNYLGVELEVEIADHIKTKRGHKALEVLNKLGVDTSEFRVKEVDFAVVKEDSSLTCGFEICTCPATLKVQKKTWGKFFESRPDNLISGTVEKCGLHIHCSRQPLTLLTIGKMLVFVNDVINKPFIECIAGRSANNYCKISKKKHGDCLIQPRNREERHEAINLMNRETVEFRIFKGTLKAQTLFKAMEFCDALIQFCMSARHSISYCRVVENFIKFVETNKKIYPHLHAFILIKWLKQNNDWVKKYGFGTFDNEL